MMTGGQKRAAKAGRKVGVGMVALAGEGVLGCCFLACWHMLLLLLLLLLPGLLAYATAAVAAALRPAVTPTAAPWPADTCTNAAAGTAGTADIPAFMQIA